MSADVPLVAADWKPHVISAGKEWIPLDYCRDIEPGSALDFSGMGFADAPAGKYGWLKNAGGRFEFEKLPGKGQRFYGVNLVGTANFRIMRLRIRLSPGSNASATTRYASITMTLRQ